MIFFGGERYLYVYQLRIHSTPIQPSVHSHSDPDLFFSSVNGDTYKPSIKSRTDDLIHRVEILPNDGGVRWEWVVSSLERLRAMASCWGDE